MPDPEIITLPNGQVKYPLANIQMDHDFNCRGHIAPIDVAELARDIQENGLMQPVILTKLDPPLGNYHWKLIAGFRRLMCHKVNSATHIWGSLIKVDDEMHARVVNLRENMQRQELSFAQEAEAIRPFFNKRWSDDKIMKELNCGRGWVQLRKMYLEMPQPIQTEVKAGLVTQTGIRECYTALKRGGEDLAIKVCKELKEAKARGVKGNPRTVDKLMNKDRKRCRGKNEMVHLTERIMDMQGVGLTATCLAWCSGEISDTELETRLKDHLGDKYRPDDLDAGGAE